MSPPARRGPWILIDPDSVPPGWADRAISLVMLPLDDREVDSLLDGRPAKPALDEEELAFLKLVARAPSIRKISNELGLSERAVQKRLSALRRRFGVGSTAELSALLAGRGF